MLSATKFTCFFLIPVLFLVFCTGALAIEEWVYTANSAEFIVELSEHATVIETGNPSSINKINAILDFFPREDIRQKTISMDVFPSYNLVNQTMLFSWLDPSDSVSIKLDAVVNTKNRVVPVSSKVAFPIKEVPPGLEKYLSRTETINFDSPFVKNLASGLAQGEDDLFNVVFLLGEWVNSNIEYNLNFGTSGSVKPASWVLRNKIGVCDEMTTLFIALARSLNIPAKYVSGYAYSAEEGQPSGPHAWSEVYFPGFGWVPFDVTFGEFGYIDVAHIKLRESIDADVPSSSYSWSGINTELEISDLEVKTELIKTDGKVNPLVEISLSAFEEEFGFGSYNYVEVDIKNKNNFYVIKELRTSGPQELKISPAASYVIVPPKSSSKVYFKLKLDSILKENFIYTIPFMIYTVEGKNTSLFLVATETSQYYSESLIDQALEEKQNNEKNYNPELTIDCNTLKSKYAPYEPIEISCNLINEGNKHFERVALCESETCDYLQLAITEKLSHTLVISPLAEGSHKLMIQASAEDFSVSDFVDVMVVDHPRLSVEDIDHPDLVAYGEKFYLSLMLKKEGDTAENVKVSLSLASRNKKLTGWSLVSLDDSTRLMFEMQGMDLLEGDNEIKILVEYAGSDRENYKHEYTTEIRLAKLNLLQKIIVFVRSFI